ncbi:Multidrug resistance regulator 1 [Sphaceloma murrayae]|uniref:Multidrug resistance regulator 1 n=1 Tax=Sphaceloma murrayae TaxID=2082308 RepID=A0A2K1QXY7_9PEZI|nr:Multidrug resistance regulator 1 [Sphaceloma murrayae]
MAQPPKLPSVSQLESQVPPMEQIQQQQPVSNPPQHYAPPPPPPQYHPHATANGTHVAHQQPLHSAPAGYLASNGQAPGQYSQNGPNGSALPANGHHRALYPIAPQNGVEIRAGKREIKRRTKTGCLTCRKRRIKCDEGHPSCRNCQKSKRECLGYDPIFKSQGPETNHTGPLLQSLPSMQAVGPPQPNGSTPTYPSGPPAYAPHAPIPAPSYGAPRAPPVQEVDASSHDTALDPALTSASTNVQPITHPTSPNTYFSDLRPFRHCKHVTVADLTFAREATLTVGPYKPSAPPPSDQDIADIKALFMGQYASPLNVFLETTWYTDHGSAHLLIEPSDVHFYSQCVRIFKSRTESDLVISHLEVRLVWRFALLPRLVWKATRSADTLMADLLHRLDVLEHLVTGAILPFNLIPPPPPAPINPPPNAVPTPDFISHSFWHDLGTFASTNDTDSTFHPNSSAVHQLHATMANMRQILSVLENRDVLYSIAIARHIGGRVEKLDEGRTLVGRGTDPEEPANKFGVAWRFLGDEEVGGTTGVVRAVAGMGRRGVLQGRAEEGRGERGDDGGEARGGPEREEVKVEGERR